MLDFTPVRTAKLGPNDLSQLAKVNRVTASFWLNGHCQPHYLLTERITILLAQIDAAVQAGLLPVPYNVTRRERGLYIQEALERAGAPPAQ